MSFSIEKTVGEDGTLTITTRATLNDGSGCEICGNFHHQRSECSCSCHWFERAVSPVRFATCSACDGRVLADRNVAIAHGKVHQKENAIAKAKFNVDLYDFPIVIDGL